MAPGGYRIVYDPTHPLAMKHGYVLEHRKIAWDAGILTDRRHQVHHINHDRLDNRPENLTSIDGSTHARVHLEEEGTATNQYGTFALRDARVLVMCSVVGCPNEATTRGWCGTHYQRWRNHGSPTPPHLPPLADQRFSH